MSSSRRFSVQRHIGNPNIHNGSGQAIPFVEYSIGRRQGRYQPQQVPQFSPSKAPFLDKMREKIAIEVENEIVKEVAKRMLSKLPANDAGYDELKSTAMEYISQKNVDHLLKILLNQV